MKFFLALTLLSFSLQNSLAQRPKTKEAVKRAPANSEKIFSRSLGSPDMLYVYRIESDGYICFVSGMRGEPTRQSVKNAGAATAMHCFKE